MAAPVVRRETCRLCGSREVTAVLSLTPTPPANAFVSEGQCAQVQATYPLDVFFCEACHHVQLLDVVDPAELFENYVYVSGTSPLFVQHFADYAADCVARYGLQAGRDLVVEIGSNDGTLLSKFKGHGLKVVGVDPARELAETASRNGIPTIAAFFDAALAARIRDSDGPAQLVVANNVLAHIDQLGAVVSAVHDLLDDGGHLVFEVSYLVDVFEKTLFDTIYHEHLDYHALEPLLGFLSAHGLSVVDAERVPTHGGSLRVHARKGAAAQTQPASVGELVALERELGLDRAETFREFGRRIDSAGEELSGLIRKLKSEGKRLAGYGAPAKATTLLYHFGLGPDELDYIIDDSPLKQGLFTPGMHIPVVPSGVLETDAPDYLVVLAWNFAEPIMANNAEFSRRGGHFIVPFPTIAVH